MADSTSCFDSLEATFRLLGAGPGALVLDGTTLGVGLPDRPIPLVELRCRLLHPSVPWVVRDAAMRELVRRARVDGGVWLVAVAGMILPGLRRSVRRLVIPHPSRVGDLQAEVLAGLIAEIARWDLREGRVASRLISRSVEHGKRLVKAERAHTARLGTRHGSTPPPPPFGHPDLVLARAVRDGVISATDAELIGETRLGGTPLIDLASAHTSYDALRKRRRRAEMNVAAWLAR